MKSIEPRKSNPAIKVLSDQRLKLNKLPIPNNHAIKPSEIAATGLETIFSSSK